MDCTTELFGNPELKRQELRNCQNYFEEIQSQIQKSTNQEIEIDEEIATIQAQILPAKTISENLEFEESHEKREYNKLLAH